MNFLSMCQDAVRCRHQSLAADRGTLHADTQLNDYVKALTSAAPLRPRGGGGEVDSPVINDVTGEAMDSPLPSPLSYLDGKAVEDDGDDVTAASDAGYDILSDDEVHYDVEGDAWDSEGCDGVGATDAGIYYSPGHLVSSEYVGAGDAGDVDMDIRNSPVLNNHGPQVSSECGRLGAPDASMEAGHSHRLDGRVPLVRRKVRLQVCCA